MKLEDLWHALVRRSGRGANVDSNARESNALFASRRLRGAGASSFYLLTLVLISSVFPLGAAAQETQPYQEYDKKIRSAEQVGPLTHGLFGDQVNVYDQSTVFRQVDVDLPGSNALSVALARRLVVRPIPVVGTPPKRYAGAGDWDVDVPYISGVFDSFYGWSVGSGGPAGRCSTNFYPKTIPPSRIENIWSGYMVNIPGSGARSLIGFPASQFMKPDSATRRWTTSSQDTVSCTPMLGGDGYPGEGFVVETTEGIKYFFDVGTSRTAGTIRSALKSRPRVEIYLLASRVEDRFGNWVSYVYNSNGHPTAIEGSDGRRIDLTYAGDKLASASAHGRTWSYDYTGAALLGVTLPDASLWRFVHASDMRIEYENWTEDPGPGCGVLPPLALKQYALEIQHPSGASGTFHFEHKRNFRTGIPLSYCQGEAQADGYVHHYLDVPFNFDTLSLVSKTIKGAGIPTELLWLYFDGGGPSNGLWPGTVPPCLSCPASKLVEIQQPDGSTVTERYGVVYALNEGKLLERSVAGPTGVLSVEKLTYISDVEMAGVPFPDRYGALWGGNDESAVKIRPLKSRVIEQDGVYFQWMANEFDARGRAIRATRTSTLPGNPSRTESTTYFDHMDKWVLGQVSKVTCAASSPVNSACNAGTGSVMSETTYDPSWAVPLVSKQFGRTVQSLTYDTSASVASGQRGTLKSVADGNGNVTTLTSWKSGIPQAIKYPSTPEASSGATRSAVVNDHGWITSVTNETGFTTGYGYDAMGRLNLIDYPNDDTVNWLNTTLAFELVTSAEYGILGKHWRQTTSTGNARKVSYFDALWRPLVVKEFDTTNVAGTQRFTRFTYDHEGRTTFASYPGASDAVSTGWRTFYDALGRPVQSTQDSEHGPLTTTKDYQNGQTRVTPPRGIASRMTTRYLAWDQPTADFPVAIAHPESVFTDIARDVFGKPTAITRRNSDGSIALTRSYVYNPKQMLCKSVDPETGATIMNYDEAGNLLWSKAGATQTGTGSCNTADIPAGQRTTRTYDGRNWLRTLAFPDGRGNQSWTYTRDGLPNSISTNNSNGGDVVTNGYSYNKRRLLENETFGVSGQLWSLAYGYTPDGHLRSHVSSGGLTVDYAPNALGQPTKAGTYATAVNYFANGAMKQFTYGNGLKHTLTQNLRGLPDTSCDFAGGSCSAGAVLRDGYDYDRHGNVAAISDGRTGQRGDRTMTYDTLDRLTRVVSPMFGTANYAYDVLDNLRTTQITAGPKTRNHTYVYDAKNRLTNVTNTSGGATVVGLGYDVQGNLANRNGVMYTFDQGNRLREVTGVEQYRYDGHGRRVLAVRGGQNVYSVYGQDGTLRFQRDERTGKSIDYVHLNGSLVAQVESAIPLSTPTLTVPTSSTTGVYTVSWTTVAIASKYQLRERKGSGSWSTIHDGVGTSKALSGKTAGIWGYQVRACSTVACGTWGDEEKVTVLTAPTSPPTLTTPTASTTGTYTVSWTAVGAATTYQLQESVNGGTFATVQDSNVTTLAATDRQSGSWSYQARGCNPAGCGAWSVPQTTQVALPPSTVPKLTVPASNITGSYTVSWTSVSTATRYELQERLGSGNWSTVHDAATTSKAVSGNASGSWGYRARGCNGGACGAWSEIAAVVVTLPPGSAPTLTVTGTNSTGSYTVSWTGVSTATRYELQERLGSGSWSTVQNATTTSKAVSGKASGSWGYRARACNAGGCAAYSTIGTAVVTLPPTGVPTLAAPTTGINGSFTVSWTAVAAATRYEMQERFGTGSWSTVQNTAATSSAASGKAGGSWTYGVRACNAGGCAAWSPSATVNVIHVPASLPTLTVPTTNDTGSYTVSWSSVATTDRYELQERLGTGSWVSIHDASATSKPLSGKATASWGYRVRACNVAGCTAYTGEKKVVVTRPPTTAPTLTVPTTNLTGSFTISWTAVTHATSYELQERLNSGSWSTLQNTSTTSLAVSGKASGSWGYQMRGCNTSGCGIWSTVKTVVVTRPPPVPAITYAHNHNRIQGDIVTPNCSVTWTSVATASSYQMMASGGAISLYSGPQTSVGGSQYCAPNYIIRACNVAGCSGWSSPPRVPTYSEEIIPPGEQPLSAPVGGGEGL